MLRWMLMVAMVVVGGRSLASDLTLAQLDRQQLPAESHPYLYYFSLEPIPRAERLKMSQVLAFVTASASQQQAVEYCTPQRVGETLYRIDTRALQWDAHTTHKLMATTPYRRLAEGPMAVNHPAWFIAAVADPSEVDFYSQLLYGKALEREAWLAQWQTNQQAQYRLAYVEAESGVAVQRVRWLMNFPNAIRTDVWGTLDFLALSKENDPLANLDYPLTRWQQQPSHDGEEWIAGLPKVSLATRARGRLQAYGLFDARGKPVAEAPGRLVIDRQQFRGHGVIVNFGGCVACHTSGLLPLNRDAVREYLAAGATIHSKSKQQAQQLDLLVLSPTAQLIEQANREYAAGVQLICGLEPAEISAALVDCVHWYDRPVDLPQAAAELYATTAELRLAIACRETAYNDLHPRQAALAREQAIPRKVWEGLYYETYRMLCAWRAAHALPAE